MSSLEERIINTCIAFRDASFEASKGIEIKKLKDINYAKKHKDLLNEPSRLTGELFRLLKEYEFKKGLIED
jgi:hypothetical protein